MKDTDEKIELILSQWQTCVEMANSVSQRRDLKTLLILVAGISTCVIWLLFIRNYKVLNTEKFKVINGIEDKLPVKPFNEEWKGLTANKKYMDGTNLEKALPYAFIVIYAVAMVLILVLKIKK